MPRTLEQLTRGRNPLRRTMPAVGSFGITRTGPNTLGNYWAVQGRFTARTPGPQSYYMTMIIFDGIRFATSFSQETPTRIEIFRNRYYYMSLPSWSKTKVRVTCTCPDYYWTWWWYCSSKGRSHAGVDLPHPSDITGHDVRVRDGKPYGTIPGSRNDKKAVGICKHIHALALEVGRQKKMRL